MAESERGRDTQVDTELPADKGKPVEELEEDHRDEPTEMQDGRIGAAGLARSRLEPS